MDMRLSPPREGVRGGREQFKWDDVKSYATKEREYYLGHSVKIGMLKHKNKFYKHDWYLKGDTNTQGDASDELLLIKLYEDELMNEMLGAKPKRLMLLKSRPTDVESLRNLLLPGGESACSSVNPSMTNDVCKDTHSSSSDSEYLYRKETSRNYTRRHRSRSHDKHRHHRVRKGRSHSPLRMKHRRHERKKRRSHSR